MPINRGLIQAISTSLSPQPIGEATKASNIRRIPSGVQGRSHFTYFLYLIVQIRLLQAQDDALRNWEAQIDQLRRQEHEVIIMESLVKKKQKGAILELKRRHLKKVIFYTYTPYPAKKIRRISANSAQERVLINSLSGVHSSPIRRMHNCSSEINPIRRIPLYGYGVSRAFSDTINTRLKNEFQGAISYSLYSIHLKSNFSSQEEQPSNSDDIQEAGSDTRPPMLDRTDYESWSQRIRLYYRGKENRLQILQSIDRGPFELGTTRNTLGTTPEGGVLLGPERPRTYDDLSSELTKEDRESQLYDEIERFKMLPGENINEYYVRFHKLVNDMRNIRMTMPNIQLNSKFVNNMSPEWDRITPTTNDPLAFVSTVQPYSTHVQPHQYPSSSSAPKSLHIQSLQLPQIPETSQIDSGHTLTDEILDNITKQMVLLAQSFRATLPQTNNHLRTSSNTRNQATIQDGRVVVQNVPGRQNQNQRYFARGNGTTGNGGAHNRAGNANAGQGKPIKCFNCNGLGHIARNCTQPKRPQNSDYFKDKMLLMQAQENGALLDEEELLFLAGEQANTFDADVDNQLVQDLALNEDNIFEADECDAFDSDVDDEPNAQSIFMANLSSAGPANLQAGPSNASILSEVHILENAIDHSVTNQDEHEIHNEVQRANVIESTSDDMGNSNVIPYEQYLSVNNVSVVPSCASSVLNDACVLTDNDAYVPHDPIATELNIYKEQVAIYEQRAKFELTEREQIMDDQMRVLIQNRNKTEENLKKELHSVKLQLNSTIENNKIIEETVTALKQEFK
ncbi:retrovirus-related pol polyprotein from transposon TNT 1-94 [Tanacetum coccineum]